MCINHYARRGLVPIVSRGPDYGDRERLPTGFCEVEFPQAALLHSWLCPLANRTDWIATAVEALFWLAVVTLNRILSPRSRIGVWMSS